MKKLVTFLLMMVAPVVTMASGGAHLDHANIDLTDKASLQRGAKYFVNYCLSCHSAKYMRYERMAEGLDLTDEQVMKNLMPVGEKMGDQMIVAMPDADSATWFGRTPPDLTLVVRTKKGGADWLYSYLRSFYEDESRPFGVNNSVFPDVGMPHVLQDLQGVQKAVYRTEKNAEGKDVEVFDHLELVTPGSMTVTEYDNMVRDLTNFLAFMGEPVKLERQSLGIKVILFLLIFFVFAYLLKKEFWKDIH